MKMQDALEACMATFSHVIKDQRLDTEENTLECNKIGEEITEMLNKSKMPYPVKMLVLINILYLFLGSHSIVIKGKKETAKLRKRNEEVHV